MKAKICAIIKNGKGDERTSSSLTLQDENICLWIPKRGFVFDLNGDKPSYREIVVATETELLERVTEIGETLIVKKGAFNIMETTIIPLLIAIEKRNLFNTHKQRSKLLREYKD